ncbi:hypothetical protein FLAG1_05556 [Fusarium langsethiae]|uniref:RanBP2-type domain-containing protein n=1 Tax=Fusarium langsethiae TaxID=179993 RepID=A0A0N0DET0_FUSLA|nr:hypothetical protein FLAG1_05556 [Fusarium langsethiae]GKU03170.1 unnamed protein product [Fusarium langsethiae]GKU20864.1 unnamed protein product [Fusarium langsethiae]
MSSGTVEKITDQVRSDHTQWQCQSCRTVNSMDNENCTGCSKPRLNQSFAMTSTQGIIGRNAGKNADGKEEWYYNLAVNGNSSWDVGA